MSFKLSAFNIVPDCTLSSTIACDTDIDYSKALSRSQRTEFTVPATGIFAFNLTSSNTMLADSFSFINPMIDGLAKCRIICYSDENITGSVTYDSGLFNLNDQIPLGQFIFGVDAFGSSGYRESPVIHYAPEPVFFKSCRVFFIWDVVPTGAKISWRMLHIGLKTELENGADWGISIQHTRPVDSVMNGAGGMIATQARVNGRTVNISLNNMTDADTARLSMLESRIDGGYFVLDAHNDSIPIWERGAYQFLGRFEDPIVYAKMFYDWTAAERLVITEI